MFEPNFESKITFEIPTNLDFERLAALNNNFTVLLTELSNVGSVGGDLMSDSANGDRSGRRDVLDGSRQFSGVGGTPAEYERFVGDVWVGILLTLMIGASVFCMCACFLYHKYRQWKINAFHNRGQPHDVEGGSHYDGESLPSYTIVSGLPSYDEALDQIRHLQSPNSYLTRPSIIKLFSYTDEFKILTEKPRTDDTVEKAPSYEDAVTRPEYQSVPSYEEAVNRSDDAGCSHSHHHHHSSHKYTIRKYPSYQQALLADHQLSVIDVATVNASLPSCHTYKAPSDGEIKT